MIINHGGSEREECHDPISCLKDLFSCSMGKKGCSRKGVRSSGSEAIAGPCDAGLCRTGKGGWWTGERRVLEIEVTAAGIQRITVS